MGMVRFYSPVPYHLSSEFLSALHELDPAFRKVTLENEDLRKVVRDLKFHHDPVGE